MVPLKSNQEAKIQALAKSKNDLEAACNKADLELQKTKEKLAETSHLYEKQTAEYKALLIANNAMKSALSQEAKEQAKMPLSSTIFQPEVVGKLEQMSSSVLRDDNTGKSTGNNHGVTISQSAPKGSNPVVPTKRSRTDSDCEVMGSRTESDCEVMDEYQKLELEAHKVMSIFKLAEGADSFSVRLVLRDVFGPMQETCQFFWIWIGWNTPIGCDKKKRGTCLRAINKVPKHRHDDFSKVARCQLCRTKDVVCMRVCEEEGSYYARGFRH
jgi:hypothetical protein